MQIKVQPMGDYQTNSKILRTNTTYITAINSDSLRYVFAKFRDLV